MKIMVLADGGTFSDLEDCFIAEVPDGLTVEEVEELLAADEDPDLEILHVFGSDDV